MTDTQTQTVTELLAPPNLYRNQHNPSKLPSYRITDRTARTTVLAAQSAAISVQLPDFSVDGKPTSSLQNASAMNPPAINTADKPTSMSSSLSSEVFSPKIPPIRSFRKPRTSTSEMVHGAAQRLAMEEDDNTLKTPDSNTGALSDDSDLFLNIAKEEANISRNNSQRLVSWKKPPVTTCLLPKGVKEGALRVEPKLPFTTKQILVLSTRVPK